MVAGQTSKNKKIAVGLSGGVDSSVSALLLKKAGYDVTGVHMQCWNYDLAGCTGKQDRADAVATASKIGIPFVGLDFQKQYSERVMHYFYATYLAGRTPNPDVLCNKEIKFGLFLNWALDNGFDYVATGHYACVDFNQATGLYALLRPLDDFKDQTYFLYLLDQAQLKHVMFPLGDMKKEQVRQLAQDNNLPSAHKPDSVGICFVGNVDLKDFLRQNSLFKEEKGEVLNPERRVIGTHNGAVFFTVGQRHGFTVQEYNGQPMYVISKNVEKNQITVGTHDECKNDSFSLEAIHWIGQKMQQGIDCEVRIRHLGQLYKAFVDIENCQVKLHEKAFGIAPGQSAVLYLDNVVLGGGVIK